MKKILVLLFTLGIYTLGFSQEKNAIAQKIATETCDCIAEKQKENSSSTFNEITEACLTSSAMLIQLDDVSKLIEQQQDSTKTININIGEHRSTTINYLRKECKIYQKRYEELLNTVTENACECIKNIPTDISHEEKITRVNTCASNSFVESKTTQELLLVSVENIRRFASLIDKKLTNDCPQLKNLMFSNDEAIPHAYSVNQSANDEYNKGILAVENGNIKKAIKHYKKAVAIDDHFIFAWDNLGRAYRLTNKYDKAIEAYKKSLAIDSLNRTPLMNIGVAYKLKKDYKNATKYYKKFIKHYPNDPEGFYGLSLVNMAEGDLENSLTNMIVAYKEYQNSKSPYQADAVKVISYLYQEFKKQDKIALFEKICADNELKLETE